MDSDIDVIIRGKNCAETLKGTVESVKGSWYTRGKFHIYFLDEGSKDKSADVASSLEGVTVVSSIDNAGNSPLVQLVDAGSTLANDWMQIGTKEMRPEVDAIWGRRDQLHPDASRFTKILHLEGNPPAGDSDVPTSEFLIRRSALKEGTSSTMVHSQALMTQRDTPIKGWDEYWTHYYRKGSQLSGEEKGRTLLYGGMTVLLVLLAVLFTAVDVLVLILLLPAAVILLYPRIFQVGSIQSKLKIPGQDAALLAWHRSLRVIPQFFGLFRRK